MKTPIFNKTREFNDENKISFHTPGHKGKNTFFKWKDYIPYIDTTELPGTDNLHFPSGIIKESQDLAAKAFDAKETIYSVNGTTGGIHIVLGAITNPGDRILIQRQSHKSIYNGAILNRLDLEYIYTNYNSRYNLYTGIDPNEIERKLKLDSSIKIVVITYPNYYGICSDIKKIAKIVHKYDKILLVDEAHGSHFVFSPKLPIHSLEAGADVVVQSTHKTLPSFTQTSMIHVGTDRVNIDKLRTMSSIYQTTSPSYLFMASLELARSYMEAYGKERLNRNINNISDFLYKFKNISNTYVFTGDRDDKTIYDTDITKILFGIEGLLGTNLSNILMKDYNIFLEMSDFYYGLALISLMNEKKDLDKLIIAIEGILRLNYKEDIITKNHTLPKAKTILPIYEAFYSNKKTISLKDSIGCISSSFIIPYPPGIPLICPGEEITKELVEYMSLSMDKGIEILGLIGYNKEKIEIVQ